MTYNKKTKLVKNEILGVSVTNETAKIILDYIVDKVEKSHNPFFIVTPNPEIITSASKNPSFKAILNTAEVALPDGIGIIWAGNMLRKPFRERITGVDFMVRLCQAVADKPITVGFLGGKGKVAEKTAECLRRKFPGLKVAFAGEEESELRITNYELRKKTIDILFVAFGFPKQEIWMHEHIGKIPVKMMMGVGGAFDYLSGNVSRAPKFIRSIGFEWLYRLCRQPWRWRRQLALVKFIWLLIKVMFRVKDKLDEVNYGS